MHRRSRCAFILLCALAGASLAAPPATQPLAGYRTTANAIRAKVTPALAGGTDAQPPYLGLSLGSPASAAAVVEHVALNSPAATAGLREGDEILRLDDKPIDRHSLED